MPRKRARSPTFAIAAIQTRGAAVHDDHGLGGAFDAERGAGGKSPVAASGAALVDVSVFIFVEVLATWSISLFFFDCASYAARFSAMSFFAASESSGL